MGGLHVHVYKQTSKIQNIHACLTGTSCQACGFYPPTLSAHSMDIAHLLRKIHKQCCQYFNIHVHWHFLQENASLVSPLENLHCSFIIRIKYKKKTPVDPCQRAFY